MLIAVMIFTLTVLNIDYSEFVRTMMVIYGLFVGGDVAASFSPKAKIEAEAKVDSDIVSEKKKK